jgi:ATP-binding cassette, subfamily F, member 3
MATILTVEELSKTFVTDLIFRDVTFQINEREHVALVGINGSGKSTLLRIVAGLDVPDSGRVATKSGLRITYLAQEARFDGNESIREAALSAFDEIRAIGKRLGELEAEIGQASDGELDRLMGEYAELRERFEHAGGYEIDYRTDQVLTGLGFGSDVFDRPARQLSGGQKTRLALARALLGDPDLLLLDEPTNHLDLTTLEWLEDFLRDSSRAFLVVSHDRYFLDRVTHRTLDLDFARLEDYPAGYGRYVKLKAERRARWRSEYEAQQEYIQKTEEFIRRYKAGQRTKEARGRETRLARLERIERPPEQQRLSARLPEAARSGRIVLSTKGVRVGFPAERAGASPTILVQTPELLIERGHRVALIGPNGGGKTTLLRTITGDLKPLSGRIEFGTNVTPAYYAQGHEGLDLRLTALETILRARPMAEGAARNYLGRFMFSEDDVFKSVSALSGGERSRLALAKLALQSANLLILDEPTNHLDIQAREALEELLTEFDGTILFVSHDRYFIDRLATHVWEIGDRKLTAHLGNYTDVVRRRAERQAPAPPPKPKQPEPSDDGRDARNRKHRTRPSDREIRQTEQQVRALEREISALEERLNDVADEVARASIDQDVEKIAKLGAAYDEAQEVLDHTYERWARLSERLNEQTEAFRRG